MDVFTHIQIQQLMIGVVIKILCILGASVLINDVNDNNYTYKYLVVGRVDSTQIYLYDYYCCFFFQYDNNIILNNNIYKEIRKCYLLKKNV